tara:strand:+ start:556 stop:1095 length:540 start_codon:yes stop_codon:yes gene_type:complete
MKIVGVDEVGLGCLAGPVIAAAVVLGNFKGTITFKDSKKTSANLRREQFELIKKNCYFSIGIATPKEVDKYNVLEASHLAMKRAIKSLSITPNKILIDGSHVPKDLENAESIIKGDDLVQEISAASIFAKHYRDNLMQVYSFKYPHYFFEKNKGYPTAEHKSAISRFGLSQIHRKSFKI